MNIERRQEEGAQKIAILHKVADIPGGVTVKTAGLSAGLLPEATLLAKGSGGLYEVIPTAVMAEDANGTATTYAVKKGHLFKVGDKINKSGSTNVNITGIDTSDSAKDIITVDATLGARAANAALTAGGTGAPVAITGEVHQIKAGQNLFVSAWVIAVVNGKIQPEPSVKPAGVIYVD